MIESVDEGEYIIEHYEYNHRGFVSLNDCFTFHVKKSEGLCCGSGNGGYTIFVNDVVVAEGGEGDGYYWEETKTFFYGSSISSNPLSLPSSHPSTLPTSLNQLCENGSYNNILCGWYASLGYCDDPSRDWMLDECAQACADCGCLDYDENCEDYAFAGHCTDNTTWNYEISWQEWMQSTCRVSCGTCNMYTLSPTFSNPVCESGSNNYDFCGWWASIGLCDDSNTQYWMAENCAVACIHCCKDYLRVCDDYAYDRCTDNSPYPYLTDVTWQEFMQVSCRMSCKTCDIDTLPSPTSLSSPVNCSDGEFQYEIVAKNDGYGARWYLYYKYPDLVYGSIYQSSIVEDQIDFPPGYEKRYNGCAKYSCFDLRVSGAYLKIYNRDTGTLISQNTERAENPRFCHYEPQPTTSPISLLKDAIFIVTLTFSTTSLHQEEIVSSVSYRSIQKILFHAHSFNEESYSHDPFIAVEYSFCEEFKCDVSFRVCNESCDDNEVLEPEFLAFIANTMKEADTNELLLLTLKQTGHHMTVEIFDSIKNDIKIEFDFEYDAWPTSSPTTSPPSSKPTQDCNQNLFTKIAAIMQIFIQGITDTFTNVTSSISDELFGVDTVNSTDLIQCKDKMFQLQIEIQTDSTPNKTSWELLYDNGTLIESVEQNTYYECDTTHKYNYCLDTSCFVFNLWDSFSFEGSYEITAGNTTLAQQDSFMWWKDTKRFCYPSCDDDGMFSLQLDLITDPWPQETSWQLAFENGTLIDSVDEGYYTGLNTSYTHRYCLYEGCYSVTFLDHIGDGMCCSYGEGSYMIKINDDEIAVKQGGKFEESETTTFCYPFDDVGCKGCEEEKKSLFEKINEILLKR